MLDKIQKATAAIFYWLWHTTAGMVLVLGLIFIGWLVNSGYMSRTMTHYFPGPPPPPAPEPIALHLIGPRPPEVIVGVTTPIIARATGPASPVIWTLMEDQGASLNDYRDGMADFTASADGTYTILATVAGEAKQPPVTAKMRITVVNIIDEPPPAPAPPPQPQPAPQPMPPPEPAKPTVASLVQAAYERDIDSPSKAKEAREFATALTMFIGQLNAGLIGPSGLVDGTYVRALEQQVTSTMGGAAASWLPMVDTLLAIIENLRQQGVVTTSATTVPTLNEAAGVLRSVH